jgi:ADP-heptose:LPS heptosyltransferase
MELRNILVLAEGQLGDLLLLTPAVRALRTGHPRARITILMYQRRLPARPAGARVLFASGGAGTASVMTCHPSVDRVLEVDRSLLRTMRPLRRIMTEVSIIRTIRSYHFDGVLCTFPEDRFSLLAYLSGARVRAGEGGKGLSRLLTVTPVVTRSTAGVLRYYCALAGAMGGRTESEKTEYAVSSEAGRKVRAWLEAEGLVEHRYVAIHPGATGEYKQWPPERFAELIGELRRDGIPVALCGGPGDEGIVQAIITRLSTRVPLLEPGVDLPLLAGFLNMAAVCLTNDSGPRHLAVAVDAPSIAIFRQHHGTEWAVYQESERCVTVTGREACGACPPNACLDVIPAGEQFGSVCLRQIGVEEVSRAVRSMFGATSF